MAWSWKSGLQNGDPCLHLLPKLAQSDPSGRTEVLDAVNMLPVFFVACNAAAGSLARYQQDRHLCRSSVFNPLKALTRLVFKLNMVAARPKPGRFATAIKTAASAITTCVGSSVVGYMDRQARQRRMKDAALVDLLLALLAARLADASYCETQSKLLKQLSTNAFADVPGGLDLLHFHQQRSEEGQGSSLHPQWFLLRGALPSWFVQTSDSSTAKSSFSSCAEAAEDTHDESGALYLVFRGTDSSTDAIRDICFEPESHQDCGSFHGGFLSGVRDDPELHTQLQRALCRGCDHLFIFGHSLGGSLAMTMVAGGFLPSHYSGPVTVVGLGSPPPIALVGGKPLGMPRDPSRKVPRYLLVINDSDVVPRLLGSPMPVTTASMIAASVPTSSAKALMQRQVDIMDTMQQYSHPEGTEALLLKNGQAKAVPSSEITAVLHLHESLSPQLMEHHGTMEYLRALEIAVALTEVFEESMDQG